MATVQRFEDLEAWKAARILTRTSYRLSAAGQFRKDFGLSDQIRRASVSVMANIAEGFGLIRYLTTLRPNVERRP